MSDTLIDCGPGQKITFLSAAAGHNTGEMLEVTDDNREFCGRMVDRGKAVMGEAVVVDAHTAEFLPAEAATWVDEEIKPATKKKSGKAKK